MVEDAATVKQFLRQAGVDDSIDWQLRRIGTDDEMVRLIIDRIVIGEKTMTYSLPWVAEKEGRSAPREGGYLVVVSAAGEPVLLLRLTRVDEMPFGDISEAHIQREGLPMRDMSAWRPLHIAVWNEKLAPYGMQVTDEMPVWAEYFDTVFALK